MSKPAKKTREAKVSACCGVGIVVSAPPFTSLLCPECVNMTVAVTPLERDRMLAAQEKLKRERSRR